MGIPHLFTKVLAATSANNIAASQSPGAGAILLNGSASNQLSTTASAAVAAGLGTAGLILPVASTTGLVAGQTVTDTSNAAIAPGTVIEGIAVGGASVILSKPVAGVGVSNGDTIVFTGFATLDTQRRVAITSGGNDSGITFAIYGTNQYGNAIVDTVTGANASTVYSNLDFLTVTNVTHTGSIASTVQIGTIGSSNPATTQVLGSTPWFGVNWHAQPFNIELSGQVESGNATWGWQYTYDDPNAVYPVAGSNFPQPWNHPTLTQQTGSLDGSINDPVAAIRLVIFYSAAGTTGTVRGSYMEAGISGQ